MKKWLWAVLVMAISCSTAATAQADFTATAIMLTMANMNQVVPPPLAEPGDYSKIHRVGIVSVMGSDIPFGGDGKAGIVDGSAWGIDAQISALLRQYLVGTFETQDVTIDKESLAGIFGKQAKLTAWLKAHPTPGIDAYIIVHPAEHTFALDRIRLSAGTPQDGALVEILYEMEIVDARTFKRIGIARSRIQTREPQAPTYPWLPVENVNKQDVLSGRAPEVLDRIHRTLNWGLRVVAVETLRALVPAAKLPPIGDRSIAEPVLAADMAPYRKLALVSALGDGVRFFVSGHMFVKKQDLVLPAALPGIDDQTEAMAREVLSHHHAVKTVPLDRAALSKLSVTSDKNVPGLGLPVLDDVDAYVVILNAEKPEDTKQAGLGFAYWIPAGGDDLAAVYANAAIAVIDARTLKTVQVMQLVFGPRKNCDPFVFYSTVGCLMTDKVSAKTPDALTEDAKAKVRASLEKMLADQIPQTLYQLGLDTDTTKPPAN